jgi:hypothetical protein
MSEDVLVVFHDVPVCVDYESRHYLVLPALRLWCHFGAQPKKLEIATDEILRALRMTRQ